MNDLSMLCGVSEINFQQTHVHTHVCLCVCAHTRAYIPMQTVLAGCPDFNLLRKQQFISMVGLYVRKPIKEEIKSIHVFNHVTF